MFYKKIRNKIFKMDKIKHSKKYNFSYRVETNGHDEVMHFTNKELEEVIINEN